MSVEQAKKERSTNLKGHINKEIVFLPHK